MQEKTTLNEWMLIDSIKNKTEYKFGEFGEETGKGKKHKSRNNTGFIRVQDPEYLPDIPQWQLEMT